MSLEQRPCIDGREVTIVLRDRRTHKARLFNVICPASWSKARFLAYVRREHPEATVRIEAWRPVSESGGFYPRLWIVAPEEMGGLNYEAIRSRRAPRGASPNHWPGPALNLPPDVAEARKREQRNRGAIVRQRAARALVRLHRDDYLMLRRQAGAEVATERGPLPGDQR